MEIGLKEMQEEAIKRLEMLGASSDILEKVKTQFRPLVTYFNGEVGEVEAIHQKALERFYKNNLGLPYYITESWHGNDCISIFYISYNKEEWREDMCAIKEGYLCAFVYIPDFPEIIELGDVFVGIEDGVIWRRN